MAGGEGEGLNHRGKPKDRINQKRFKVTEALRSFKSGFSFLINKVSLIWREIPPTLSLHKILKSVYFTGCLQTAVC